MVLGGPGASKIIALFCQVSTAGKDYLEEMSVQGNICQHHPFGSHPSLLTFSELICEDFCFSSFFFFSASDGSIFSTFAGGYKNTAIAEKREETPKSSLISKRKIGKVLRAPETLSAGNSRINLVRRRLLN